MKSSMSNQDIRFKNKLLSSFQIFKHYSKKHFGNVENDISFHKHLCHIIEEQLNISTKHSKILEIGCGQKASQVAMFRADGADIIGIDIEQTTYLNNLSTFIKAYKINGFERALKSLVRSIIFDRKYFNELKKLYNGIINLNDIDTRIMDAAKLEFPDNEFDFVFSKWVFEHISEVSGAAFEINRVLRPGGIFWVKIHLFPSLTGGHNLEWNSPEQKKNRKAPPWDHLRENIYPVNTYLNKLKINDYLSVFNIHFNILEIKTEKVGEKLLTSELYAMLNQKGYSKEDLVTESLTLTCVKK